MVMDNKIFRDDEEVNHSLKKTSLSTIIQLIHFT